MLEVERLFSSSRAAIKVMGVDGREQRAEHLRR